MRAHSQILLSVVALPAVVFLAVFLADAIDRGVGFAAGQVVAALEIAR